MKWTKEQQNVIDFRNRDILVSAAAGSGKTAVLVARIIQRILDPQNPVDIDRLLVVTFTKAAAAEMRERVDNLVGFGSESIWVSTFHSTCVRILRRHIDRLGYDTNFTIYDTDDQKTLMKDVCKLVEIDTKVYKERNLLAAISSAKNEMISAQEYAHLRRDMKEFCFL
jgi:DNA helicase-2/ATP-dependent DNA helicase PcrA